MTAVAAITAKIGRLLVECNRPTPVEAKAPIPIWMKPSSADALPTFLLKRRQRDRGGVRIGDAAERQIEQQQNDVRGQAVPAEQRCRAE